MTAERAHEDDGQGNDAEEPFETHNLKRWKAKRGVNGFINGATTAAYFHASRYFSSSVTCTA